MNKYVHLFSDESVGKDILGGKGASLSTMTDLGLPIPFGFTITTSTCIKYLENNEYPEGTWDQVLEALKEVEKKMEKGFGDKNNPLLLSVRSGARISMPGMMDTVLNLGLNREIVQSLSEKTGNPRFVRDSYRRLIQMFSDVVCELDMSQFHAILDGKKEAESIEFDYQLTPEHLDEIIDNYEKTFEKLHGSPFPQDPLTQLDMAVQAVFKSWNNKRAIDYRNFEGIPHHIGTAVNVQAMAFGNYDENSGTGVLFTRNPSTGVDEIFGEYLVNAQGEDVVAGIRTPQPLSVLNDSWPELYKELDEAVKKLEVFYKDMQDCEFTIEQGKLYILQTRTGKRTAASAAKIATDLVEEGLITKDEAILRITARDVESSIFPKVLWKNFKTRQYCHHDDLLANIESKTETELIGMSEGKPATEIGKGLPAGPGAASGHVVFSSHLADRIIKGEKPPFEVTEWTKRGEKTVPRLLLVKNETSPEDFHGMVASMGILTMTGGMTSHAALVGRQIGKRVIVGASTSGMQLRGNVLQGKNGEIIREGDVITIEVIEDGLIYNDNLPIFTPKELPKELDTILSWADDVAEMKVRANADKEDDTQMAVDNKSTGTGLARTEHQFFDALDLMKAMIMEDDEAEADKILEKMQELQKQDFVKLFTVSNGRPVTIRLLDPPLHEFLPHELEVRQSIYDNILDPDMTMESSKLLRKVLFYQEANPMLGLRGVRLGLMRPNLIRIQARAIIEAGMEVSEKGINTTPEIMIPLISTAEEFRIARKYVDEEAEKIFAEKGKKIPYLVGTMIEIPRAALTADEIAAGELGADFFSFGTNDLHQMGFGFSRDDVAKFLPFYLDNGILDSDPFQTIDEKGVGKLMDMSVTLGRAAAKEAGKYLKVGICGEQGGDPASIDFCYRIGLDYVSCSPFRIPVARLSSAQSTIRHGKVADRYLKDLSYQK